MRLKPNEESENYIVRNIWLLPTISGFFLTFMQYAFVPAFGLSPILPDQLIILTSAALVCLGGVQNIVSSTLTAKVSRWFIIFGLAAILIAYYQHVTQAN